MRKYSWIVVVMLIGCIVAFASCRRMEEMIAPVISEPDPPTEMVEPPVEMMPMAEEGIGIFDTNVMPGHGLIAEAFYPGVKLTQLPDFDALTPFHTWMVANIDVPHTPYERGFPELGVDVLEDFGIRLRGQLKIETAGDYNFKIQSDDGAQLYINGELIVDNDGLHAFTIKYGSAPLAAGYHDLEIRYFQGPRTHIGLQWSWQPPDGVEAIVPPEVLYPPGTGDASVEPMVEMEMPSQANLTDGLVLHLSFDEDTIQGNIVTDQSTEGNDGIINGAAQTVPGKHGEAMEFDGTDDFVEVPLTGSITFSTGDSFTVQVWVKTDDAPQLDDAIVGNYRQPTDKFWDFAHLGDNPAWRGRMSFNLQSGTDPQSEEPIFTAVGHQKPLNDNEWHVLTAVRDQTAKKLRFYVDGELIGEVDDTTDDINSGQSIWIGEHRERYYKGLIDEVKIWNRPLTAEELQQPQ